jgi:hypothetical protein
MSKSLESLENLYLDTLAKADINNPNHMEILFDLRERIQKAKAGTRKIENAGAPIVYGNTSTGNVEGVVTKGPAHNTISEKIEFPRSTAPTKKELTTEGMTEDSWVAWPVKPPKFPPAKPKKYNRYTGPKYTKEKVIEALNKFYSLWEAGSYLGMTDPNYMYQLVKKYGIKRDFGQQKLPLSR